MIHPSVSDNYAPFLLLGISHHRAGVAERERWALPDAQQEELLHRLHADGVASPLVISTCNRTQVFVRHADAEAVIGHLVAVGGNTRSAFEQAGEVLYCKPALERLFQIATGLDSQILGDLQIVKQVKTAYELTCRLGYADSQLHRLHQHLLKAHKRVRRETGIGRGSSSVASAAVQFVLKQRGSLADASILLVGAGKIGKVTCKNLVSLQPRALTVLNRNRLRAETLATKFPVRVASFDQLAEEVARHDVVIVATGASTPVLRMEHVRCPAVGHKTLIDLSVPRNIAPEVGSIANVTLADLDALQAATDDTYIARKAEVPKAQGMLTEELDKFDHWLATQKVAPTIKALTATFEDIRQQELAAFKHKLTGADLEKIDLLTERIVKKIAARGIEHLRANPDRHDELAPVVRALFQLEAEA